MKLVAFSILVTATIACTASAPDDASTSSATTAAPTNAERICAHECEWQERCGVTTLAACSASCARRYVNGGETLREEYVANAEACFPTLRCDQIDDVCLEHWGTDTNVPEMDACVARNAECGGSLGSICFAIPALTDATRATAAACLAESCADVRPCIRRALGVN